MNIKVDEYVYRVTVDQSNPNAIPASAGLMKGDILVYRGEGNFTRLQVGPDGSILTADSSEECGVKWAAPAVSS